MRAKNDENSFSWTFWIGVWIVAGVLLFAGGQRNTASACFTGWMILTGWAASLWICDCYFGETALGRGKAALVARRLCTECGYDLRATDRRCPECGHELSATPEKVAALEALAGPRVEPPEFLFEGEPITSPEGSEDELD